jgi:perosamine synthetase
MSSPEITKADEEAVLQALRSGVLGLGPAADQFELLCAAVAGTRFAVAVSSGTAALHLIATSLGIGPGDEVLVPSFTFAASVNAILYVGAKPVFCDIEPDTFNVDPAEIPAKRTSRTTALMVVDVFGHPADWDAIDDVAKGLAVIDDSCEAIGSEYRGRPAGGFGNAGCFAFYPNKQITTGEGGMIVTDDDRVASLCRSLRNQGRGAMGAWLEHERLGFNYRLDEMSAALGVSQVDRLDEVVAKRSRVAKLYTERLSGLEEVRPPTVRSDVALSWFVYVVTVEPSIDRDRLIESLAADGIPSRAYFTPLHLQPYIEERFHTRPGDLPITESIAQHTLALPFHNNVTEEQVDRVVAGLEKAIASGH